MTRTELREYIEITYHGESDHPWANYPEYEVFRHSGNKKWFALVMELPKNRLGLSQQGNIEVINLKCDPVLIGSLRGEPGIFPAYHMNKDKWITVALDGSVPQDTLNMLLDISFELTRPKQKKIKTTKKEI